jgi:hypothetical protein
VSVAVHHLEAIRRVLGEQVNAPFLPCDFLLRIQRVGNGFLAVCDIEYVILDVNEYSERSVFVLNVSQE